MSRSRNVFTVSSASTATTPRVWRDDLDMPAQLATVKYVQASNRYKNRVEAFNATCASRENHRAFLAALIDEARRYCTQHGVNICDSSYSETHIYIASKMAIEDNYPKLVGELFELRMFQFDLVQSEAKN